MGDAHQRGKDVIIVGLTAAVFGWPSTLLLWLVFRPDVLPTNDTLYTEEPHDREIKGPEFIE